MTTRPSGVIGLSRQPFKLKIAGSSPVWVITRGWRNLLDAPGLGPGARKGVGVGLSLLAFAKQVIDWPPTEALLKKLETLPFTVLAKELGVSDNAIRKRIKNYPAKVVKLIDTQA